MLNEEGLFWLNDRIEKIKQINEQYDLEHNSYLSFSGGKDSTVLHYLLDMALPNNNIPRVYINTGIEYNAIIKFVIELSKNDNRIKVINSNVNIKKMLQEYGYPFKSKEHCKIVNLFKNGSTCKWVKNYIDFERKSIFKCPKILRYQFTEDFSLKLSGSCCYKLKRDVIHLWEKENKKIITMTGMRNEEGGQRANLGCLISRNAKVVKFHPLMPLKEVWLDWFIDYFKIELCELYYPPFNFKRTGCKGCPFALDLQKQLDVMERLLPEEKRQCEILWKSVYEEYRRIGYRLRKNGSYKQTTIFDFGVIENG